VRDEDLELFISMASIERPKPERIYHFILVPAFALSELRTGFIMGFFLYIPFIMVDLIVSSILLSDGYDDDSTDDDFVYHLKYYFLFLLTDGNLVVGSVVRSFGA
jgi:flagellar biosynthetic protein FliP